MASQIPSAFSQDLLNYIRGRLTTGGEPFFEFRTGAAPGVDAVSSGTNALNPTIEATGGWPAPTGSNRTTTKTTGFTEGTVDAGGPHTVTYWRLFAGDSTHIVQGTTGTAGSGDINFNNLAWATGGKVNLTSVTLSVPASISG